jgi:hypothetical protein
VVRESQYSFAELYDWTRRLRALSSVEGAVSIGIDEVRNRVSIHIAAEKLDRGL